MGTGGLRSHESAATCDERPMPSGTTIAIAGKSPRRLGGPSGSLSWIADGADGVGQSVNSVLTSRRTKTRSPLYNRTLRRRQSLPTQGFLIRGGPPVRSWQIASLDQFGDVHRELRPLALTSERVAKRATARGAKGAFSRVCRAAVSNIIERGEAAKSTRPESTTIQARKALGALPKVRGSS